MPLIVEVKDLNQNRNIWIEIQNIISITISGSYKDCSYIPLILGQSCWSVESKKEIMDTLKLVSYIPEEFRNR